jgi:hypothetical protein
MATQLAREMSWFLGLLRRVVLTSTLKIEAERSSETSVSYHRTTRRKNPENHDLNLHSREKLQCRKRPDLRLTNQVPLWSRTGRFNTSVTEIHHWKRSRKSPNLIYFFLKALTVVCGPLAYPNGLLDLHIETFCRIYKLLNCAGYSGLSP